MKRERSGKSSGVLEVLVNAVMAFEDIVCGIYVVEYMLERRENAST